MTARFIGGTRGISTVTTVGLARTGAHVPITGQDTGRGGVRLCDKPPTCAVDPGVAKACDLLPPVETPPRLAVARRVDHGIETALSRLTRSLATVLGLSGIGVTIARADGRLHLVTAVGHGCGALELDQVWERAGPCRDACDTGEVVRVRDVREESDRWPEFSAAANCLHVAGVAGVPMRVAGKVVGVLYLYSSLPRGWSDQDISVARVLADVATGFVINFSHLRHLEQLSNQLQEALSSRVVIEQAKGMTASRYSVTIAQAYLLMRTYARDHNAELRVVAEAIVAHGPSGPSLAAERSRGASRGQGSRR